MGHLEKARAAIGSGGVRSVGSPVIIMTWEKSRLSRRVKWNKIGTVGGPEPSAERMNESRGRGKGRVA